MRKLVIILILCLIPAMVGGDAGFIGEAGGVAVAPAASFCDGTELFCCGWETGSDGQNTGASGNEDVWDAVTGTVTRAAYDFEADYGISMAAAGNYLTANNGGSGYGDTAWALVEFEVDTESLGLSASNNMLRFYNDLNYTFAQINIEENGSDYDTGLTVIMRAKTTSSNSVAVGDAQSISLDTKYQVLMYWSSTVGCRWFLYSSNGTQLYDSGAVAATTTNAISTVFAGSYNNNIALKMDASKITATQPAPFAGP